MSQQSDIILQDVLFSMALTDLDWHVRLVHVSILRAIDRLTREIAKAEEKQRNPEAECEKLLQSISPHESLEVGVENAVFMHKALAKFGEVSYAAAKENLARLKKLLHFIKEEKCEEVARELRQLSSSIRLDQQSSEMGEWINSALLDHADLYDLLAKRFDAEAARHTTV